MCKLLLKWYTSQWNVAGYTMAKSERLSVQFAVFIFHPNGITPSDWIKGITCCAMVPNRVYVSQFVTYDIGKTYRMILSVGL
jgi:hypothetical protein